MFTWRLNLGFFLSFTAAALAVDPTVPSSVTVKISTAHGRAMVPAIANGSNALSFLLDTGYGITTIHPRRVDSLGMTRAGQITIVGIADEESAPTYSGLSLDFGGVTYSPRRVASLPSEAHSRERRDGILGAGFFKRFVVVIDTREKTLELHSPESFTAPASAEMLRLSFDADTPIVAGTIVTPAGETVPARLEIDTGCDDALCFGRPFVDAHQLDAGKTEEGAKVGVGGRVRLERGHISELRLGKLAIARPEANFFRTGSPAGPALAGHMGMALLGRYKLTFDYSRQQMFLEQRKGD